MDTGICFFPTDIDIAPSEKSATKQHGNVLVIVFVTVGSSLGAMVLCRWIYVRQLCLTRRGESYHGEISSNVGSDKPIQEAIILTGRPTISNVSVLQGEYIGTNV